MLQDGNLCNINEIRFIFNMALLRTLCYRVIKRIVQMAFQIGRLIRGMSGVQIKWQNPPQVDVVIYDETGAENFYGYLKNVSVLSVRGEIVYVPVLVRAMLSKFFWENPLKAYVDEYIQKTSPRLLLTFIDNNPNFYELADKHSGVKTIIVQNGWRNNIRTVFSESCDTKKYHVDYMFMFGKSIGSFYGTKIDGKIIGAGSFKSNSEKIIREPKNKVVLFLSQISSYPTSDVMFVMNNGKEISEEIFYAAETELLPLLHKWCSINEYQLQVCSRSDASGEEEFYKDLLKANDWEYVRKNRSVSSYQLVDKSEIVVAIDSTLGLESLGRGNKTAFFDFRSRSIDGWPSFCWPNNQDPSGPFWSNLNSYKEVDRVLQFLVSTDMKVWQDLITPYCHELMSFDEGNSAFLTVIDSILNSF